MRDPSDKDKNLFYEIKVHRIPSVYNIKLRFTIIHLLNAGTFCVVVKRSQYKKTISNTEWKIQKQHKT